MHSRMNCWVLVSMIFGYSFHGNYSFLNLEIVANSSSCCNISILCLINRIFAAESIPGPKLNEVIQYLDVMLFWNIHLKILASISILAPLEQNSFANFQNTFKCDRTQSFRICQIDASWRQQVHWDQFCIWN